MTAPKTEPDLRINGLQPITDRVVLFAVGVLNIFLCVHRAREAFTKSGLESLPLWITVFIFSLGGIIFLLNGVFGMGKIWTFHQQVLTIEDRILVIRRFRTIRAADIANTVIATSWSKRAVTFRVVLYLNSGEWLETPNYKTKVHASDMKQRIRRAMGIA